MIKWDSAEFWNVVKGNYAAVNCDGGIYTYLQRPRLVAGYWGSNCDSIFCISGLDLDGIPRSGASQLIERAAGVHTDIDAKALVRYTTELERQIILTEQKTVGLLERLEKRLSFLWAKYPWLLPPEVVKEISDIQAMLKELR